MDYAAVLAAIVADDDKAFVRTTTAAAALKYVDTRVTRDGAFGDTTAQEHKLKFAAGDSLLHLAVRNKKWNIKTACVVDTDLNAKGRMEPKENEAGETAPGIQLQLTVPRFATGIVCFAALYFKALDKLFIERPEGEHDQKFIWISYLLVTVFILVTGFDTYLAYRWFLVASNPRDYFGTAKEEKKKLQKAEKRAAAAAADASASKSKSTSSKKKA